MSRTILRVGMPLAVSYDMRSLCDCSSFATVGRGIYPQTILIFAIDAYP